MINKKKRNNKQGRYCFLFFLIPELTTKLTDFEVIRLSCVNSYRYQYSYAKFQEIHAYTFNDTSAWQI